MILLNIGKMELIKVENIKSRKIKHKFFLCGLNNLISFLRVFLSFIEYILFYFQASV